jgi:hypothetical protein
MRQGWDLPLEWFLEPNEKEKNKIKKFCIRCDAQSGSLPEGGFFVFRV